MMAPASPRSGNRVRARGNRASLERITGRVTPSVDGHSSSHRPLRVRGSGTKVTLGRAGAFRLTEAHACHRCVGTLLLEIRRNPTIPKGHREARTSGLQRGMWGRSCLTGGCPTPLGSALTAGTPDPAWRRNMESGTRAPGDSWGTPDRVRTMEEHASQAALRPHDDYLVNRVFAFRITGTAAPSSPVGPREYGRASLLGRGPQPYTAGIMRCRWTQ
jgi:hypothetical protein